MRKRWTAKTTSYTRATETLISLGLALGLAMTLTAQLHGQAPALTTINDTVYRADGTPAQGVVLISWPTFQTAQGEAVTAGNLAVTLGAQGAFSAQLVPNAGAMPAGTYYVAVFQLDDGTVRTEYWAVPTTSPTTIGACLTTPGTGLGNFGGVTEQYVNAAVAQEDAIVVHRAGTETITGVKQFSVPPSLPTPVGGSDAANKGYVDAAVANVGAGAFVPLAGGTMTGPLTLPGGPTAPNQAADRTYVDTGLLAKADLTNGTVPTAELGTGTANAGTCLTGNSTWGACGGSTPPGIAYATTALTWTQTVAGALTGGTQATVTLSPCPVGIDTTSGAGYQVYLAGGGNSEAVNVAAGAGGCTAGAASGTITFTPYYTYAAGAAIGSASSGIQESLNAACGVDGSPWKDAQCNVTIPANGPGYPTHSLSTYNVYGTIYLHSNQSVLSGYGVSLNCLGRGACLQIGDLTSANDFTNNTVGGLSFRSPTNYASNPAYAGVAITQTQRTGQVVTITTASAHGFRVGDMVTILFTDNSNYWGDARITAVPSGTTFQYAHTGADIAAQATPGVVALAYVAVLDDGANTHLNDLAYDSTGENGTFNNFFDFWDDENATIEHFNNQAESLNANANWTGSFIFSAGNQGRPIAPVITLRDSSITANYSNGVTDYNSNGLYIENTIIQASGPWQVYAANTTGNYQGAYLKNLYSESSAAMNPQSPVKSPFAGLGIAGLIAGAASGSFQIAGTGGPAGAFATGGTGTTAYSYYVVANDTTTGTQTSPMQILNWLSTGSDAIAVRWPRVANGTDAITYDVIRMSTAAGIGQGQAYPYNGGCTGGTGGACGYVAKGLTQAAACGGGLVCSYADNGGAATTAYTIQIGDYAGNLAFWPGGLVSVGHTVAVDNEVQNPVGVSMAGNPLQTAKECTYYGVTSPGGYTSCLASVTAPPGNGVQNQSATLLTDGAAVGGGQQLSKGRLNFSSTPFTGAQPHHIITLIDSQPGLTQATWGYRPAASANDTWIGTDVPSAGAGLGAGQLAFGSPVSITNYIAQTGDGIHANWLERLNAGLKEFNVPVKFDQGVTLAGLANGCLNVVSGVMASTGSPCGTGSGGGSVSSVFGRTGAVTAATGDYTVGQVTGAAVDTAVVHLAGVETMSGAKTFAGGMTASGGLILPQGSGYVPATGGMGLDTAAGIPVVNINGTPQQMALTSSNISGQAGTALALAATPTQCNGAFATGIAANGNANCSTADVLQLAETSQPNGIPNWGVLWFDATTHTPRVIENNGAPFQLGLTNLYNSDPGGDAADNLEEYNPGTSGTQGTAQNLRVYSNYNRSAGTWTRMSLGYDAASGYQVVRSEDATSGNALGLGMYIGSSLKWGFAATGVLKPNTDNSYDLGTDTGQAMRSVFAKTSFNMYSSGRQDFEFANDGTTGTTANSLAVYNSGGSGVQTAGTASTDGVVGIVSSGAGTTGKAVITWAGLAACNFDAGNPVAGDYVVASTTQGGQCHDTGSGSRPSGAQVIGRIEGGNVRVSLGAPSGGGGAVSSVFGRTGAVMAGSGDYAVGQVTGAAADATVVHLAGVETISGAKTFTSTVTLTGNLNVAGNISQTGTGPTQWSGQEWTGTTVTVPTGMAFSLGVGADGLFRCQLGSGASCMAGYAGTGTLVAGNYTKASAAGAIGDAGVAAGPYAVPWAISQYTGGTTVAGFNSASGKAQLWGFGLTFPETTTQFSYYVQTADTAGCTYDIGILNTAGNIAGSGNAHLGNTAAAAGGFNSVGWHTTALAGSATLQPGKYYVALTASATSGCAALGAGSMPTFLSNTPESVSAGGSLNNGITIPADSVAVGSVPSIFLR